MGEEPPVIRPPEPIGGHVDASSPEATEWWKEPARNTLLFSSEQIEIQTPPNNFKDFVAWVDKTTIAVAEKKYPDFVRNLNPDQDPSTIVTPYPDLSPRVGARLLAHYAISLVSWQKAEKQGSEPRADFTVGAVAKLEEMIDLFGLEADRKFIELGMKRLPEANFEKLNQRFERTLPPLKDEL